MMERGKRMLGGMGEFEAALRQTLPPDVVARMDDEAEARAVTFMTMQHEAYLLGRDLTVAGVPVRPAIIQCHQTELPDGELVQEVRHPVWPIFEQGSDGRRVRAAANGGMLLLSAYTGSLYVGQWSAVRRVMLLDGPAIDLSPLVDRRVTGRQLPLVYQVWRGDVAATRQYHGIA